MQKKVFLYPKTNDGRPLLVIKVCNHVPIEDIEYVKNFIIYCLEAAAWHCETSTGNPDAKINALMDLRNIKWSNLDSSGLKSCFSVLATAFPERVKKIYMLDSPLIFDALWKIVRPFVDPTSRENVKFIYGSKGLQELHDVVGQENLPSEYSGHGEEASIDLVFKETRQLFQMEYDCSSDTQSP